MADFFKRVHVVLAAAVTWIGVASAVIAIVWAEVVATELIPDGTEQDIGRLVGVALAFLAGIVAIIRRVTPVIPDERGILPAGGE